MPFGGIEDGSRFGKIGRGDWDLLGIKRTEQE